MKINWKVDWGLIIGTVLGIIIAVSIIAFWGWVYITLNDAFYKL